MFHIQRDTGEVVPASTPVIISASRSTDIPAFYPEWFFNRLAKGYCAWYNPFNMQKMYVSFAWCKAVVFWTKNPKPILPYLPELDRQGIHYYFQFTLNDYEREGFEPHVPLLAQRIETFRELSRLIGRDRVIWRFDPLILTADLDTRELLSRIARIGNRLKGYTDKLVFSFVDVTSYRKVQYNMVKETRCFSLDSISSAEANERQQAEIAKGLSSLRDQWKAEGWDLTLATCAEKMDLETFDIEHNRCIDGELMKRIFADDEELCYYLDTGELPERNLFGQLLFPQKRKSAAQMKDKGQRKLCSCMISKDIGTYNTCRHFCVYCYANTSCESVMENARHHSSDSESLIL